MSKEELVVTLKKTCDFFDSLSKASYQVYELENDFGSFAKSAAYDFCRTYLLEVFELAERK